MRDPGGGDEPEGTNVLQPEALDARFTFANERTLLAWNRTALALIGGGLAAAQFLDIGSEAGRTVVALVPIVLGAALAVLGYRRWQASERAMHGGQPLPDSRLPALLAAGVGAIALVAALVVAIEAVG